MPDILRHAGYVVTWAVVTEAAASRNASWLGGVFRCNRSRTLVLYGFSVSAPDLSALAHIVGSVMTGPTAGFIVEIPRCTEFYYTYCAGFSSRMRRSST
jgi:hypothetical protein